MPRETERHAAVLNKLKSVIQHTDSKVVAERRLAIERWVKTYIRQVEYLKDDKLQFLYNIFRDESCWSGTRLNNTILGQRLTEEKTGGIENPLSRYNMACRYCVIDKIPLLFQRQFESYKSSFSSEEVDDDGKPATSNNKYVKSELLDAMKSEDPVFTFWIDKKSGCFKKHDDAVEGFNKAVEFKWSEGVEYFYNLLSEKGREKEITDAVTILSSVQCNHNGAVILDFCLSKMSNQAKNKLFKDSKLSKQDKGVYSLLNALIDQSFFDTVQAIIPMFRDKVLVDKILSHQDYALLFSSLSDTILENPELGIQAKAIMMDLWRCEHFNEHKKAAVDFSNSANLITDVLADLVIDWKNDNNKDRAIVKKGEILEILQFAKKVCSPKGLRDFKEDVIDDLRIIGRNSMKKNVNYSKLAEELFAELDKVSLPSEKSDIGGAGDPQSTLRALGISGFSCHSK